ncbi:MAG: RagB/SusD family nutrient uptake outer membrane protein, partial [Bacteroidia bacterium]|nr:RagB/SusD family nutrient uptake outer membrane protein [Bacteroidia bacterium]
MKKYIITLILFMGLVSSCDLKEDPYGIYSKENMFSNETGAQSVLLSAYRSLCDVD